MQTDASQDLDAFVATLQDRDFYVRAGRSFALLRPGDWPGLQRWAESFGFSFTLQALLARCRDNPSILGQMSGAPHLSDWSLENLSHAAEG
jgi:hypothetical protein